MVHKEIDAAMAWEPWIQRMVHEANARIIATKEGDLGIYTNVASYSARRDWLRDHRATAVRFLRALVMAYGVLHKDPTVGILALAEETGMKQAWVETIYRDAPPPKIYEWTNPRYDHALVKGSVSHRRLGALATFLFEERVIPHPVDVSEAMDISLITEALEAWKRSQ